MDIVFSLGPKKVLSLFKGELLGEIQYMYISLFLGIFQCILASQNPIATATDKQIQL